MAKKPSPLTTILNSINKKTELLSEDYIEEHYAPFLVNKILAGFRDTIAYASQADKMSNMTKMMQYEFYYYGVRKRSRFSPWTKNTIDPDIEVLMEYYNFSQFKAMEAYRCISPNNMKIIRDIMMQGGRK